jgi:hypothetical protein
MSPNVACFVAADFLTIGGSGGDAAGGEHCVGTSSAAAALFFPFPPLFAGGAGRGGATGETFGLGFSADASGRGWKGPLFGHSLLQQ